MNRLLVLFFVCVIDVLGFGIMIPLLPYMGDRFGASPTTITWVLMSYAACQFVAAPIWGRLSDRYGRRPILVAGLVGGCVSYVILGLAQDVGWLFASRVLGGLMAGNISAALAYASDISAPKDRAKSLGTVGAAIGIGFMLGPAIGGLLAGNDVASADFIRPAIVSVCLALLAIALVAFVLPESRTREQRDTTHAAAVAAGSSRSPLALMRTMPGLRSITLGALLVTSAQAILESVAALWALKRFGFGPASVGVLLFSLAFIAVLFQGGLVRALVPRFGELRLARTGAVCYAVGLAILATSPPFAICVFGLAICGVGLGLWQPTASAVASRQSTVENRGAVMGTFQSSSSLARIVGPAVSGPVFAAFGPSAPFAVGVLLVLPTLLLLRGLDADGPH
jgi:DHA1 family tetracycline resistance protein-like MFS transporter